MQCLARFMEMLPASAESGATASLARWLRDCSQQHIRESLPLVACGHWMGDHWTATFALLALEDDDADL
jgi:hypothetical protein